MTSCSANTNHNQKIRKYRKYRNRSQEYSQKLFWNRRIGAAGQYDFSVVTTETVSETVSEKQQTEGREAHSGENDPMRELPVRGSLDWVSLLSAAHRTDNTLKLTMDPR